MAKMRNSIKAEDVGKYMGNLLYII